MIGLQAAGATGRPPLNVERRPPVRFSYAMNSWQLRCRIMLVKARPPTTKTFLSYCFSFSTSERKSLSPPTITYALMWRVRERHFEGVEGEVDVRPVLVAAGRQIALHQPDGVLREMAAVLARARPVGIGDFGDHLTALLQGVEDSADVEILSERRFDADFDVVEVDEDGDVETVLMGQLKSFQLSIFYVPRGAPAPQGRDDHPRELATLHDRAYA